MAEILSLSETLGTGLSATSNPDPSTLSTLSPYPTPFVDSTSVSTAWSTQAKKALFPIGADYNQPTTPIKFHVIPSNGEAVTYTITLWFFNRVTGTWAKAANSGSCSYTGCVVDYIENPGRDPMYLQLSDISSGTLSIYVDGRLARAF